jgi:hypothetical protein
LKGKRTKDLSDMSFSVISSFCQFVTAKNALAGEEARDSDQPIRELTLSAAFSARPRHFPFFELLD